MAKALHPDQFKNLVDSGQSVIYKGNVVNKNTDIPVPSAVDLAGDDITRKQVRVDLERKKAELEAELAKFGPEEDPASVETKSEPAPAPADSAPSGDAAPASDNGSNTQAPSKKK